MNSQEIIKPDVTSEALAVETAEVEIEASEHATIESNTEHSEPKPEPTPASSEGRRRARPIPAPLPTSDQLSQQVEKILEDGLRDTYANLSPLAKEEFKLQGEKTTAKIRVLLNSTRVKAVSILRLILEWLHLLPAINQFFLLKEAKIKTDKILDLKKNSNL